MVTTWSTPNTEILLVPALRDNYIHVLRKKSSREILIVDPGENNSSLARVTGPFSVGGILLTHHHADHVNGTDALRRQNTEVFGFSGDAHRLPKLTRALRDQDTFEIAGFHFRVLYIPGHTLGHIAYYEPREGLLFCGDTVFGLGCGRLFEGTAQQMFESLAKIAALPEATHLFCGHEYTRRNLGFALRVDPENSALAIRASDMRDMRDMTMPTSLSLELQTNPFFRTEDVETFAELRRQRDLY